jgi:alpha-D-xyloside xylohydrolase
MKFTDGNWLMREGVKAFYPAEAHDIKVSDDTLIAYATRRINHRGDTLTGPLLTVEFSSPMPDVVRVKLTHFAGQRPRQPASRSSGMARLRYTSPMTTRQRR